MWFYIYFQIIALLFGVIEGILDGRNLFWGDNLFIEKHKLYNGVRVIVYLLLMWLMEEPLLGGLWAAFSFAIWHDGGYYTTRNFLAKRGTPYPGWFFAHKDGVAKIDINFITRSFLWAVSFVTYTYHFYQR